MLFFLGCVLHETSSEQTFVVEDPVAAVLLDSEAGDITVTAGTGPGISLSTVSRWAGGEDACPNLQMDKVGDTVSLQSTCPPLSLGCSVDWTIEVAENATIELKTAAGDILISNLNGQVTATSNAGDITVEQLGGVVSLESSAGDISGLNLQSADFTANTSAGDISLTFAVATQIAAESGAGDIFVAVPEGAWNLDIWSGAGDVNLFNVEDQPGAERSLQANTGAGDIQVTGG